MAEEEIALEKLVLIENDLLSQRLIVTWEKAYLEYGQLLSGSPADLSSDDDFAAAWGRIANVDIDDIERRAPVLFENGLLLANGVVSETALGYVQNRLISEMPKVSQS